MTSVNKKKYEDFFQNKPINLRIGIKINLKDRGLKNCLSKSIELVLISHKE